MTHLLVDVRDIDCHKKYITDRIYISSLIDELCRVLNFNKLGPTYAYEFNEDVSRGLECGLTAFQVLATSHISYHSNAEVRGFQADIFSCTNFDAEDAMRIFNYYLPSENYNYRVIHRDVSYVNGVVNNYSDGDDIETIVEKSD